MKSLMTLLQSIQASQTIRLKNGELLFNQNDPTHGIYYLQQGQIQLLRNTIDGNSVILFTAQSNDTIAEASLFSEKYHCAACAEVDSIVLFYDKQLILTKLQSQSDFALHYIELLAKQVQSLRSIKSPEQRLLQYLLLNIDKSNSYSLPSTDKKLAIRVGMSHETLYWVLAKLEKQHLIARQEKIITYLI